jgi:hypothetical protein
MADAGIHDPRLAPARDRDFSRNVFPPSLIVAYRPGLCHSGSESFGPLQTHSLVEAIIRLVHRSPLPTAIPVYAAGN